MINTLDFDNTEYFIYGIVDNILYRLTDSMSFDGKKYINSDKDTLALICPDVNWAKEKATKLFTSMLPRFPIKDYKILTLGHDELSGISNYLEFEDYYDKCYRQYIIKQDTNSLNL